MNFTVIRPLHLLTFTGILLTIHGASFGQTSQLPMKTDWRYVKANGPERMILNVKDPIDIRLCVSNSQITANFEVTTGSCSAGETKTVPVSTGCASLGSVRRVSMLASNNPNAARIGGEIWHVDFDADLNLPPLPNKGKKVNWSYIKPNQTTLFSDKDKAARLVRVCVAEDDLAMNFTMDTAPCNGNTTQFMVNGVKNSQLPDNACALVQTTAVRVESAHNPNVPRNGTSGTYTLLR